MPFVCRLEGALNVEILERSFRAIIARHEVLRTVIREDNGIGYQVILPGETWRLQQITAQELQVSKQSIQDYVETWIEQPFDLANHLLLRVALISESPRQHTLVVLMHHIASDGWSVGIMIEELVSTYQDFLANQSSGLKPLSLQYADYAIWQRAFLSGSLLQTKLHYWETQLKGLAPLDLPTDFPRPLVQSLRGGALGRKLDRSLTSQLHSLSNREGVTLFMTLLGAFNILLWKYSRQPDICVGTPFAGRQQAELEPLIGFFVNMIALRNQVSGDQSFPSFLHQVKTNTLQAFEHQDLPFGKIVEVLEVERDMSRTPVFQVMFALEERTETSQLQLGGVQLKPAESNSINASYDLSFTITNDPAGLVFNMVYASDLFEEDTINRMLGHYEQLLRSIVNSPGTTLSQLSMISPAEEKWVVHTCNDTAAEYPAEETIAGLFARKAVEFATNTALVFEGVQLTYEQLDKRANQLAHYLRAKGVVQETFLPICFDPSPEMIISILAVLKTGAAYVPIDPTYPAARIAFMIEDTAATLALTAPSHKHLLEQAGCYCICAAEDAAAIALLPDDPLPLGITPQSLAYVIYTSGSTGKPKGVLIEQRGVLNLIPALTKRLGVTTDDRILQFLNYCFDVSVEQIFLAFFNGATLVLISAHQRLDGWKEILLRERVTHMQATGGFLMQMEAGSYGGLKRVINCGEPCSKELAARWAGHALFFNEYGPTEITVSATLQQCDPAYLDQVVTPDIGTPLANTRAYILDEYGKPVPVGVVGELYLAGVGVARGYLNREEQTNQRFLSDPFHPGSRMYRTGDLARRKKNGLIECLGRIDTQLKVRGYRIEAGEIEHALHQVPGVQQAVVLAVEKIKNVKQLIAYLVTNDQFQQQHALQQLKEMLPEYMVPSFLVELKSFTLNANGKVDRKVLAEIPLETDRVQYEAPAGPWEERMAIIWKQLLAIDTVGANDNFFKRGGHSLLGIRLIALLRVELGIEVKVRELFAAPTIRSLCALIAHRQQTASQPRIRRYIQQQHVPLSFAQERLWFIDKLQGSIAYNMPWVFNLQGTLDTNSLETAFRLLIDRHSIFRTVIREEEGIAHQEILPAAAWQMQRTNIRTIPGGENGWKAYSKQAIATPFDLSSDYMLRAELITISTEEYKLIAIIHHIAFDGWSIGIMVEELMELYSSLTQQRAPLLKELPIRYTDYALWQRQYLAGELLQQKLDYWKDQLQHTEPLALPTDHKRNRDSGAGGAVITRLLSSDLHQSLLQLSQQQGATLFMTLLSAFKVLLHRYCAQSDICVGVPISGRQQQELEGMIGFFVNTLVLRSQVESNMPFTSLLEQVKQTTLDAYEYQDLPFEKIVEALDVERDMDRTPVFQVMFALQNMPGSKTLQLEGIRFSGEMEGSEFAQFDLSLDVKEEPEGMYLHLFYATALFNPDTIQRMLDHFGQLLQAITANSSTPVGSLKMLGDEEATQMISQYNNTTDAAYLKQTITARFEEQAHSTPTATALVFEETAISYKELNDRADQLAAHLQSLGVKAETLVPLCYSRSMDMIIAILAIMKAGGAYVPIDPTYPAERIRHILEDTQAAIVLTTTAHQHLFSALFTGVLVNVDDPSSQGESLTFKCQPPQPDQLAYVIYTSGSTGKPRGVLIEHQGVVNMILRRSHAYGFTSDERILLLASYCFDASVEQIFLALLNGHTLVIASEPAAKDSYHIEELLRKEKITHLDTTPGIISTLTPGNYGSLKRIISGGEVCPHALIRDWSPFVACYNEYGPTETTVTVIENDGSQLSPATETVPIGIPGANTTAYILDAAMNPVPPGITGELYIGGIQVARGYLNLPEQTAQKFIPDPFTANGRLYKTGDNCRRLPNGHIEYLGRIDEQVKIRGYRIEPGEIENTLRQAPGILQSVVMPLKDGQGSTSLVAFVVTTGDFQKEATFSWLHSQLPSYMVPGRLIPVEEIPVTPHGKTDKRALQQLAIADEEPATPYAAPLNEMEKAMATIWQTLLQVEKIGMHDNFFRLGGHSLLGMRLIAAMRKELAIEVKIHDLFLYPTIRQLVGKVTQSWQQQATPQLPDDHEQRSPLSFAQERLWFIDQLQHSVQYHMPYVFRLHGHLDSEALNASFRNIIERHEVLRTVIRQENGVGYQWVNPGTDWNMQYLQANDVLATHHSLQQYIDELIATPFDLANDPMIKVWLIRTGEQDYKMLLLLHHIAADGWSVAILQEELAAGYVAFSQQQPIDLPPLPMQYREYAIRQRTHLVGEVLEEKRRYWSTQLTGVAPLELFTDHPRPAIQSIQGKTISKLLNEDLLDQLLAYSQQREVTLFMTALTAWKILLFRYTGQTDICIGSPTAGRLQVEMEGMIGFFINTIPLRSQLNGAASFEELLQQVKQTTLTAFEHQDLPFEKMVENLDIDRDLSRTPVFQVTFSVENPVTEEGPGFQELQIMPESSGTVTAKFELGLIVTASPDGLLLTMTYCSDLFTELTIRNMLTHYSQLLEQLMANSRLPVGELKLTSREEEKKLLYGFNNTATAYPAHKDLVELFEEQVRLAPNAMALVFEEEQFTYQQLSEHSNQLAHYLLTKGIGAETLVPLCITRSADLIISILGILKAGGAYVPIDPSYPASRIRYMLEDTGATILLSQFQISLPEDLPATCARINIDLQSFAQYPTDQPIAPLRPTSLAYIMYTSGSTGTPKGVQIEHRNIVSLVKNVTYVTLNNQQVILSTGSPSFDASTFDYWAALLNGGKLVMCTQETLLDTKALKRLIARQRPTTMFFTTGWFNELVETDTSLFLPLDTIVVGGEKVSMSHFAKLREACPNLKMVNGYGPTENATFSTFYPVHTADLRKECPIGYPLSNRRAYILNDYRRLCPVGVVGEICVGGDGLGRGYLNQPALTSRQFIDDPFNPGQRLYKTGDLGRWTANGAIEFLGRKDEQVKIRGHRIEPGEIENILCTIPLVQQAAVITLQDSNKNHKDLVAFVVMKAADTSVHELSDEPAFDRAAMLAQLQTKLPAYMIPSRILAITAMPLTANGKVDKQKLKALPIIDAAANTNTYTPPGNATEAQLAAIWQRLLSQEQIGIHDNFFSIGGHSLLAMRVVSAIRHEMGMETGVRDLFEAPTIHTLAILLADRAQVKLLPAIQPTTPVDKIPLSFAQERLLFIDRLQGSVQYHIPIVLRLEGRLHKTYLENAFRAIIERHTVLRTVIREDNGIGYQRIMPANDWAMQSIHADALELTGKSRQQWIEGIIRKPFDLANDPMLKVGLLEKSNEEHLLVVLMHHIASDGWSISVLVNELTELYQSQVESRPALLKTLPVQYADYAIWQRNHLSGEILEEKVQYWKDQLTGLMPLELQTDRPRAAMQSINGAAVNTLLDKALLDQLQQLSQSREATLFMTLLSALKILLFRYTGQADICIGCPIAGRQQQEVEGLIGFFVNTLPVRSQIDANASFEDLLQQVKHTTLGAYEHQDLPFEKMVETLDMERDLSRTPVFQVTLTLQNTPDADDLELGDIRFHEVSNRSVNAKFDFGLSITESPDGLYLHMVYGSDLFEERTISNLLRHYEQLLRQIVLHSKAPIGKLKFLQPAEEQQLLHAHNYTSFQAPAQATLIGLFEEQARKTPGATALTMGTISLTYQELEERAQRLATYLISRGVTTETLVPICVDRSPEMIIALFGVLKAGGAYVPIDPEYPAARIQYILEDTAATHVVTDRASSALIKTHFAGELITVEQAIATPIVTTQTQEQPLSHHLAYVIYTSGSTGKPKGVLVEHRSIVNYLSYQSQYFGITTDDRILQLASYCFDASVEQIFLPLLNGATLVLVSEAIRTDKYWLAAYLEEQRVTHIHATPAFLNTIESGTYGGLKRVVAGGEQCSKSLASHWTPLVNFYNKYGPTETTVSVLEYHCQPDHLMIGNSIPLGKPVGNTAAYILDASLEPLPIGAAGELYIGGIQVARGYLNQPILNAEKFIPDPFTKNARLYKTGDICRRLHDGNIEFIGRIDDQVKIRGYRIETGEIERVLQQGPGISQTVVIIQEDAQGDKTLAAYYVATKDTQKENIVQYLREQLPAYMVPPLLIQVEEIPRTHNGKADRRKLQAMATTASQGNTSTYEAPANGKEEGLVTIWQRLLRIEKIGVHDNFFRLGGHSLIAMRLIAAIRKELHAEAGIKDIFTWPTIRELANKLFTQQQPSMPALVPVKDRQGPIPLSFAQERLWFIHQLQGSTQYHMRYRFQWDGPLDVEALTVAFRRIVDRHQVLRTVIIQQEGVGYQSVTPAAGWDFQYLQAEELMTTHGSVQQFWDTMAQTPFDLSADNMLKVWLVRFSEQEHCLFILMHHIAADGLSINILLEELAELYNSQLEQRPATLRELPVQYSDHAIWQRSYLSGQVLEEKLSYWKKQLQQTPPLGLPTDFPRPSIQSVRGAGIMAAIDKQQLDALNQLAQQEGVTLYMLLLSAYKVLLHRYSGQTDICVGTPVAGRTRQEVESLIGFFANTLALPSRVETGNTFTSLLQQVKQTTLQAYEHQDLPFEKLVEALQPERDLSRTPLFQVMFAWQHSAADTRPALQGIAENTGDQSNLRAATITVPYDLTMNVRESATGIRFSLLYATDLFAPSTIQRMLDQYIQLLQSLVQNSQALIGELAQPNEGERKLLLETFNNTTVEYPADTTIIDLFAMQVEQTPGATAVLWKDQTITYQELDERSTQLAQLLAGKGIQEGQCVAICLNRSINMVISILAVLKTGAAYVPIDPAYPPERTRFMLEDARTAVVLTESAIALPGNHPRIDLNTMQLPTHIDPRLEFRPHTNQLAYVIYTSGSTGQPKGVMIGHESVYAFISWCRDEFSQSKVDCVYAVTSICFDLSIFELFYPLTSGIPLRLLENGLQIGNYLPKDKNVLINTVPSMVQALLAAEVDFSPVSVLNMAGEPIPLSLLWQLDTEAMEVRNLYGPSEDTTYSTMYRLSNNGPLLIGKPIANTSVYILDEGQRLQPIGVAGEICLAGKGLARGYLHQEALTQERFVPDPFSAIPGQTMYRTGDLGRWREDGNIEYLGRIDNQVKIRGYRIEPGEIEAALLKIPGIKKAAVIAMNAEQEKQLVAFVVTDEQYAADKTIEQLKSTLPKYMVPASVVPVAAIPLTPNGKVDRKQLALLKPVKTKRTKVLAPANPTEEILVKLWEEMLGHQPISVTDNFFELGGHSLIMIRLLHRMRGEGLILQLRELYQYQTIREQAKVIQQMTVAEIPAIGQATGHTQATDRPVVAAPANRHLLLLQATGGGRPIFIVPGSNGISEGYDGLAAEFAGVCPVYGIQMQGVFEGEKPLTDIRQIAALHNRWIREVQPSGPYRLIGHSFGAHVVYEMAHQLQQQGEVIECIAMLDKHPQKRRIRIEDPVTFAWKAVAKMFTTYQWTLTGSEADLAAMEASLSGEDVMTNFHQIAAWIAQTQPDPHGAIAHGLRLLQLTLTHMFLDYKLLGRLKSPLIIARAAEASWQEWGEDLGWGKRTSQVMPLLVPGDHFSMIKGDGARVLGEFIKKRLG